MLGDKNRLLASVSLNKNYLLIVQRIIQERNFAMFIYRQWYWNMLKWNGK